MNNNISPVQPQSEIRAQAREWVIRFNRDTAPSKADIAALNQWANQSPVHRAELHSAEQAWCDADLLAELAVPVAPSARHLLAGWLNKLGKVLVPTSTRGFATAAMVLSVSIVTLSWYLSTAGISGNGYYQTAIGEHRTLVLEDRSVVQMDTNSRLHIAYSDGKRQLSLEQGKAHFDVAKNPDRPFEVYASSGMVQAVGTAFSVFIDNSDIRVTVDEGRVNLARVEAAPANKSSLKTAPTTDVFLSLDRGQSALFNQTEETMIVLADNELSRQQAWRRGLLIFAGEPLAEVVREVSRYTSTTIEISDPELRQLLIGGRFRTGELEALIDVLEAGFGVQVSYIGKDHIQLRMASK
jgi:transmembrane sensor